MDKTDLKNFKVTRFCTSCNKANEKGKGNTCMFCGADITYCRAVSKTDKKDKFLIDVETLEQVNAGSEFFVEGQVAKLKANDDDFDKFDAETKDTEQETDNTKFVSENTVDNAFNTQEKPEANDLTDTEDTQEATSEPLTETESEAESSPANPFSEMVFNPTEYDIPAPDNIPEIINPYDEPQGNEANESQEIDIVQDDLPFPLNADDFVKTDSESKDEYAEEQISNEDKTNLEKENEELKARLEKLEEALLKTTTLSQSKSNEEDEEDIKQILKRSQETIERQTDVINELTKKLTKNENLNDEEEAQSSDKGQEKGEESKEPNTNVENPKYIFKGSFEANAPHNEIEEEVQEVKVEQPLTDEEELKKRVREKVRKEYEKKKKEEEEERLRVEFENRQNEKKQRKLELEKQERENAEKDISKNGMGYDVNSDGFYNSPTASEDDTYKKSMKQILFKGLGIFGIMLVLLYVIVYVVQNIL